MKKLIVLTLALLTQTQTAWSRPQVKKLEIPKSLQKAVNTTQRIGRGNFDYGEVSKLSFFALTYGSSINKNITALVDYLYIGEGSVEFEGICGFADLAADECASNILANDAKFTLEDLRFDNQSDKLMDQFDDSLNLINEFIREEIYDGEIFSTCNDYYNADSCVEIHINTLKNRAVVIEFNYGA